ncbi:hypothetical protein [Schleiferilactobacillus shenzhenensis]|uniref:Uncharacterized protein n=1 Tax=Schleiferilactobacillus shenzhenensis LY-73 TaxID=1231336 RepID=U4TM99_9LACO|nr:hypothetical protein [Schleiferilactobacillus shenzhenensis]ERL66006.1 hypothetical protein L248_2082 [Schleiferilactobacillus shenzhenensis LY-73]
MKKRLAAIRQHPWNTLGAFAGAIIWALIVIHFPVIGWAAFALVVIVGVVFTIRDHP